jgi:hypothetical protein
MQSPLIVAEAKNAIQKSSSEAMFSSIDCGIPNSLSMQLYVNTLQQWSSLEKRLVMQMVRTASSRGSTF